MPESVQELIAQLEESRRQLDMGEFKDYDDESLATRIEQVKEKASGKQPILSPNSLRGERASED